ncbi:hypothetical protein D3C74_429260 [compost metagenome]
MGHSAVQVGIAVDQANLQDALVLLRRFDYGIAILQGMCNRLFQKDMLAVLQKGDRYLPVHEVRHTDHNGIKVFLTQQFMIVGTDNWVAVVQFL